MKKKNKKGGKSIIFCGIIAIAIVTICAFYKNDIIYIYYKYNINKKYSNNDENDYYLEDNFKYVENYTDTSIKDKNSFFSFIYYSLNSGIKKSKRYIDRDYSNYSNDIAELTKDECKEIKEKVSILNNFVHPYNSSKNIKLSYDSEYTIGITVEKVYTDEEIEKINEVVDKVIGDKINNDMPTQEKIKVIHDYIIDNTLYDKLKNDDIRNTTYKSQTAYGALIEGYATCNGYADAMAIFLNKLNVINYKISNDKHIWNLVYLDGKWYHLDLTWDDSINQSNVNRDTYFLITTPELENLNDNSHNFNKDIYSEAIN